MSDTAPEMVVEDESIRSSVDTHGRRKRHRQRRKKKAGTPYSPPRGKQSVRAEEVRNKMFTHGQPVAPYNTTQFIMEDHNLPNIDAQLSKTPNETYQPRNRDSSFSIDSDEDFFYASPVDEEEFLTKEFSMEYQDLHVERLNSLPKEDIIRDYLVLENKYEKTLLELCKQKGHNNSSPDGSSKSEVDGADQLKLALLENRRLKIELEKLKRQNSLLQSRRQSDSSVDSESDSSSSSSSIDSDSSPSSPLCADSASEAANPAVAPSPSACDQTEENASAATQSEVAEEAVLVSAPEVKTEVE